MAQGHVRPGQSVAWKNETGAPVRSGALVHFGSGVTAKALHDIAPGAWGEVTLFQVHRFPMPDGLSFAPGEMVYADGGKIAAAGDVLGRFIRVDEGGWAEVLILPLNEGGSGPADTIPWNKVTGKPSFAAVATSGDYNDLIKSPVFKAGAGLKIDKKVNAQGVTEYTISLDLELKSVSDNLTIKKEITE